MLHDKYRMQPFFLQVGFIQMIKHFACKNLCHAFYDFGVLYGDIYCMAHKSCNTCRRVGQF